MNMKDCLI